MSNISIFSGSFCNDEAVLSAVAEQTGYRVIADADMIAEASRASGLSEEKIGRTFNAQPSVFNKFTHERERALSYLRLATAQALSEDRTVISGFVSHLIPRDISHVLRVCLIADMKFRLANAREKLNGAESDAVKVVHKQDEDRSAWVKSLVSQTDPWAAVLYDMVLPTDKLETADIARMIGENAVSDVVRKTGHSEAAVANFLLEAEVAVALVKEGHHVGVHAKDGVVTLTINKHVLMLHRLENELKSIAGKVGNVKSVETKVGPGFYQADIYRKQDFTMPSKILLVDDEREFVQTLSERLLMRDMGSAVAYDGESALEVVREDEPDVMILDLKMPGIDGIEVLRRVKDSQPEIEVIILTGHGSDADRETCLKLGAFAYLQKPVDVEELSETIKQANEKIQRRQQGANGN
jgi:CheY-like chemotaxis protein